VIADPETDLALSLLNPDGTVGSRWGADEGSVGDVPRGLGFTTSDPGGFKDANLALARDINVDWPDLDLLRALRIYGRGQRTAWEGRLHETPRHHAEDFSINPGAVGHVARLDDDPSFAELYIDADLSKWGEPSSARKVGILGAVFGGRPYQYEQEFNASTDDSTYGAGVFARLGNVAAGTTPFGEMVYYGGGPDIGKVRHDYRVFAGLAEDANMDDRIYLAGDDAFATLVDAGASGKQATALNKTVEAAGAGRKYAEVSSAYLAVLAAGNFGNTRAWLNLKVIGRHGLTERGVFPAIGFYGSDVVTDIVKRVAPDLNYSTGPDGSIVDSTFAIPHLTFPEGVKGSDAILGVNAFHQRSWGVYDDKTFFWRPATSYRKRWRIRRSKGHGVDLLGPQAEDAINGVVVTFTDPSGITRVVGPPECRTAFATSEFLADPSPSNPVNLAGITRKWGELKLGFITTTAGAIQVGAAWLQEKLTSASSRGSVVVSGLVEDDATGTLYPSWAMRAGDSAVVTDGDNVERGIIETTYDHDSRTCTCNLDATPHKVEALMERMGIVLTGVVD
jgi:hypothetical protein